MKSCPECRSEKIVKDAYTSDYGDGAQVRIAVDEEPEALILKKRKYSEVRAEVCADCGNVQLYAKMPDVLWSAYQSQRNKL